QELRRLADHASSRDLMRLFRLMADAQEEILKSPYPDLLLEMAVVRMASLAPVVDANELLRAIGASSSGGPAPASSGSGSGGARASSAPQSGPSASARRLPIKGEVKAEAPLRQTTSNATVSLGRDLPELRDHIRSRRAALAGFMEQGAALA